MQLIGQNQVLIFSLIQKCTAVDPTPDFAIFILSQLICGLAPIFNDFGIQDVVYQSYFNKSRPAKWTKTQVLKFRQTKNVLQWTPQ